VNGVGQVCGSAQAHRLATPSRRVEPHLPCIQEVLLDHDVLTVWKIEAVATAGSRAPRQGSVRLHLIWRREAKEVDALGNELQVLRRLDFLGVRPWIAGEVWK
jgi:hypothetical protein